MIVVMVLAFLVTWLPYAALALAVMIDSSLYVDPVIATIPVYFAKSSTVFNPIIYIFMNRQVSWFEVHLNSHIQTKKKRNSGSCCMLMTNHDRVLPVSRLHCCCGSVWMEPLVL